MINIVAAITCMLWPGAHPRPLALPRTLTIAPQQTIVISYEVGHHFGKILVPNPTIGVEVRVAQSGDTAYVSLTNHNSQTVNLRKDTAVARLITGQCAHSEDI